uniref:Reverse transcriptase zinc-binding domain-containing protein n=1 Tax=Lactuca sativa TaxID=4236 RepID=A0A9R1V5U7_LACSA|nr:hypothetical protein LSAT_V11C600306580 [Lactuca sativa]
MRLYGHYGGLLHDVRHSGGREVWQTIVDCIKRMESENVLDSDAFSIVMGDGYVAWFWEDVWCGGMLFKTQFHRLFFLSLLKDGLVSDFWTSGGWSWSLDPSGVFSVSSMRRYIDSISLSWIEGVELESILCPICHSEVESVSHLFFQCKTACQSWRRLEVWLDVSFPIDPGVSEMLDWIDSL